MVTRTEDGSELRIRAVASLPAVSALRFGVAVEREYLYFALPDGLPAKPPAF